jgi:DNA polymerase-1
MASSKPHEKFNAFIQGMTQAELVGVDTETTGLSVQNRQDYLQGMSLSYNVGGMDFACYIPLKHIDKENNVDPAFFQDVLFQLSEKPTAYFNRKFDLHSIATTGLHYPIVPGIISYCGLLLAQLVNENKPFKKDLENCAQLYIGKGKTQKDEMAAFTKTFGWAAVPSTLMTKYAEGDAIVTRELVLELVKQCRKKFGGDFPELWQWEQDMNTSLFQMESPGIHVDQKFCRQYASIAEIEMSQIEENLGFKPSKTTDLAHFLFDDLELPILEYTDGSYTDKTKTILKPNPRPAMTKDVMEEYERMLEVTQDDRARQVLDFRGWQKASSSFYLPFQHLADTEGKIHCNYKQHGTVTGRLSCTDPNLQQIPRQSDKAWNGRIRTAFRATPGFRLVGFDYSQLELRLAAAYGQEQWLIDEFSKADADPFTVLSLRIGSDRYTAKTFTYGLMYGAGLEKTSKILRQPLKIIQPKHQMFLESIPGIMRAKKQVEQVTKQRGYVRYWTGRRRNLWSSDAYKAWNSLLQGGGAEVVKRVLVKNMQEVCDDDCRLLLQIHDELVFEIREDMVESYSTDIVKVMEEYPTNIFDVQFRVQGKVWGE